MRLTTSSAVLALLLLPGLSAADLADGGLPAEPLLSRSTDDAGPSTVAAAARRPAVVDGGVGQEPLPPSLPPDRMPVISLSVDPLQVHVGELVTWRLTIKRRPGDRVHLPTGASFGDFQAHSKEITSSEEREGWVEENLVVRLISFSAGDFVIPALELTAVDIQGRIAQLHTDEATVRVSSLIANEPEPALKEDLGSGEVVYEKDYTLLWILGALAGIGVVALLTLLGRWLWARRRPRPGPPPPPPRPAEEIALEKLEALRGSDLLEHGRHKEFHIRLSEAMREYLGNRYRFDSLERSTEELVDELERVALARAVFDRVVHFLEETDLVKFAKLVPTLSESQSLLELAFATVEVTSARPVPSGEGATDEDQ